MTVAVEVVTAVQEPEIGNDVRELEDAGFDDEKLNDGLDDGGLNDRLDDEKLEGAGLKGAELEGEQIL